MNDSIVKCGVCGYTQRVSFSDSLKNGWPKHHGRTMELITHPTEEMINRAVKGCFDAKTET